MKQKSAAMINAKSRRKRAQAVVARAKRDAIPAGIDLVDFREPTAAERKHAKSLESRARELLSRGNGTTKPRKLATTR